VEVKYGVIYTARSTNSTDNVGLGKRYHVGSFVVIVGWKKVAQRFEKKNK